MLKIKTNRKNVKTTKIIFLLYFKRLQFEKRNKMGKRNAAEGNKPKKVRQKSEVIFDESKRADFLTGFRKRKDERRKRAKTEFEKKLKDEIKIAK